MSAGLIRGFRSVPVTVHLFPPTGLIPFRVIPSSLRSLFCPQESEEAPPTLGESPSEKEHEAPGRNGCLLGAWESEYLLLSFWSNIIWAKLLEQPRNCSQETTETAVGTGGGALTPHAFVFRPRCVRGVYPEPSQFSPKLPFESRIRQIGFCQIS